mgnify:FL=1
MHDCEYCEMIRPGEENEKELVGDEWAQLHIGCDEDYKIYLKAKGIYDVTWYPNFCPVCGRNLLKYRDHPEDDPRFAEHFFGWNTI